MSKMNDLEKVKGLCGLLDAGQGTVEVSDLVKLCGTERRARRSVFVARKGGMKLEPVRTGGRGVTQYIRLNPEIGFEEVKAALLATRKRHPKQSQSSQAWVEQEAEDVDDATDNDFATR